VLGHQPNRTVLLQLVMALVTPDKVLIVLVSVQVQGNTYKADMQLPSDQSRGKPGKMSSQLQLGIGPVDMSKNRLQSPSGGLPVKQIKAIIQLPSV